jgi:hypothetical protein
MSIGSVGGSQGAYRTTPKSSGFSETAGGIFKSLLVGGASFATGGMGGVGGSIVGKLLGGSSDPTASGVDGGEMSQTEMLEYQQKILAENRYWTTESNVMKSKHDTMKTFINNFRS